MHEGKRIKLVDLIPNADMTDSHLQPPPPPPQGQGPQEGLGAGVQPPAHRNPVKVARDWRLAISDI